MLAVNRRLTTYYFTASYKHYMSISVHFKNIKYLHGFYLGNLITVVTVFIKNILARYNNIFLYKKDLGISLLIFAFTL